MNLNLNWFVVFPEQKLYHFYYLIGSEIRSSKPPSPLVLRPLWKLITAWIAIQEEEVSYSPWEFFQVA